MVFVSCILVVKIAVLELIMSNAELNAIGLVQKERLKHIDFMLMFLGEISRGELVERFGIGTAAASRDLASYADMVSENIIYNSSRKNYTKAANFSPLFNFKASDVLNILSGGRGSTEGQGYILSESPAHLNEPSIEVIAAISTAIHKEKALSIGYRSLSSGKTMREIIPHALVNNGLRWHVRAYDRKRERFTDFVLTRILQPELIESDINENERLSQDHQWNRIIELVLVPHPERTNGKTIELDYNMTNGEFKLEVRAAVAGYILRRWNVDCSKDHSLIGDEYHLWLKNRLTLYGVDGLTIAPGFEAKFE